MTLRCRIYRAKEGFEYLIPQCGGCLAGDEIMYMGAREYKERFCTCEQPGQRPEKVNNKRDIAHLQFMLDDQQEVIQDLLEQIKELKKNKL